MKAFHWGVMPPKNIEKTIWKDLSDEKSFSMFDKKLFEETFGVVEKKQAKNKPKKKKKEMQVLFDPNRAQNITIALSRFKLSHDQIKTALLELDENILNEEKCASLKKCISMITSEELELVRSYDGKEDEIGPSEKFFRTISIIPRIKIRTELWLFKQQFGMLLQHIQNDIQVCEQSQDVLKNSKTFPKILEMVLAFGNYLNGGTKKGGVYGFKLSTINKLQNLKSVNGKTTLLHFLVSTIQTADPQLRDFVNEFACLKDAKSVEEKFLDAEVSKLDEFMNKIQNECKKPIDDSLIGKDKFKEKMEIFHEHEKKSVVDCQQRMIKLKEKHQELTQFFGESEKVSMDDFFRQFCTFIKSFIKAEKDVQKQKEKENRLMRSSEKEKKSKTPSGSSNSFPENETKDKENKESTQPSIAKDKPIHSNSNNVKKGAVDSTMATLKGKNTDELLRVIHERRTKRQNSSQIKQKN